MTPANPYLCVFLSLHDNINKQQQQLYLFLSLFIHLSALFLSLFISLLVSLISLHPCPNTLSPYSPLSLFLLMQSFPCCCLIASPHWYASQFPFFPLHLCFCLQFAFWGFVFVSCSCSISLGSFLHVLFSSLIFKLLGL